MSFKVIHQIYKGFYYDVKKKVKVQNDMSINTLLVLFI